MHGYVPTLEFQLEGEGGLNREAGKFRPKYKKGGCNKWGGWQESSKLINGKVGWNKRRGWENHKN